MDDYIHFEPMLEEMVASYEPKELQSQINKDIFMCPKNLIQSLSLYE